MTTSEPTTGEIVRALREVVSDPMFRIHEIAKRCRIAADRLESQEREIERLKEELEQTEEAATVLHAANETHWTYIKELTARAESAERERDAARAEFEVIEQDGLCSVCKFESTIPLLSCIEDCCFKWRGLQPQEGDKDE